MSITLSKIETTIRSFVPSKNQIVLAWWIYAIGSLSAYIWSASSQVFDENSGRLVSNALTLLAAWMCAVPLTLHLRYYHPTERPRRVWLYFAAGLWAWTLGEFSWAVLNSIFIEVPGFTLADLFWLIGYGFLTASLAYQYSLINFDRSNRPLAWALVAWVATIAFSIGMALLIPQSDLLTDTSLYFYPVADLMLCGAALVLLVRFRMGAVTRPWLSLFIFILSDTLYALATSSGNYQWMAMNDSVTLWIDTIYIVAYLAMSWGVMHQYLLYRTAAKP